MYKLPDEKKIKEQVETIRFALLDPKQEASDFFSKAGCLLYEELIKPAEPYLSGKSRLIIIPDGILNYLPYEVLLTDNKQIAQKGSYSALPFLVKKYPVSYGQSASVLKTLLSEQKKSGITKPGNKKLIAFGDPISDTKDVPLFASPASYNRLQYSRQEVERISALFKEKNSEIYLGKDATEENLKRNSNLKNFNYLHFATHGSIDEEKPDLSSLVLAKGANSSEDGYLQASEIFNLKLNADLVVLSACQTGLGKLVRGEGMVGLTRSFMYAGTPSVLASLWSVSDLSTASLMEQFYRNLIKNKLSKTEALRKAQLTLMSDEKYAHPFYWAPFVLFGDWM
jgi:CHAT domain-containing protein